MDGVEVSGGQQRATPECHAWNVSVCVCVIISLPLLLEQTWRIRAERERDRESPPGAIYQQLPPVFL